MLNTLVLGAGIAWILWKFFSEGNLRYLLISLLLIEFTLSRWPLFLSMQLTFGAWALTAAGFMIYENYYSKGIKNSSSMTSVYILLFIAFGLFFLGSYWIRR